MVLFKSPVAWIIVNVCYLFYDDYLRLFIRFFYIADEEKHNYCGT